MSKTGIANAKTCFSYSSTNPCMALEEITFYRRVPEYLDTSAPFISVLLMALRQWLGQRFQYTGKKDGLFKQQCNTKTFDTTFQILRLMDNKIVW